MNILISGTSGFIGGHISQSLRDMYNTNSIGRSRDAHIKADFGNIESTRALDLKDYDAFIHCAGVIDEDFKENPEGAFQRSTHNFSLLLDKVVKAEIKVVVYFSTAHVYGQLKGVVREDSPVNPLSDYAIAHFAAEQILQRYTVKYGIKALIIRPMAVYGIPQSMSTFKRWHLIPYSFLLESIYNKRIELQTSGSQERNFISIKDISAYVRTYLEQLDVFEGYTILNPIGSDTMSVHDFAMKCSGIYNKLTGSKCEITRPPASGDSKSRSFQCLTLNNFYLPSSTLDEYLETFMRRLLKDYENNIVYGIGL
jgi:UDP-glucose 4-epimerase